MRAHWLKCMARLTHTYKDLCMYVCNIPYVHVCVCVQEGLNVYTYAYTYVYIHIYIYLHKYMYTYTYAYMTAHVPIHIYIYIYTYTHTNTYVPSVIFHYIAYMLANMHACIRARVHIPIWMHIHVYTYKCVSAIRYIPLYCMYVSKHTCIHDSACSYTYMNAYARIHIQIRIRHPLYVIILHIC